MRYLIHFEASEDASEQYHTSSIIFLFYPRPAVESGLWIPDQSCLQRDCKDDWFAIIDSQEILLYNSHIYLYDSCGSMSLMASWHGLVLNTQSQPYAIVCSRVLHTPSKSWCNLCLHPMNVSSPNFHDPATSWTATCPSSSKPLAILPRPKRRLCPAQNFDN